MSTQDTIDRNASPPPNEDDPWRAYMDKTLSALREMVDTALQPWCNAGEDADALVAAAQAMSPAGIIAEIMQTLIDMELWYRQQMDEFAGARCTEAGIRFTPHFSDHESGWLPTAVQSECANLRSALTALKGDATAYAEFVASHSGVAGFLRDGFRGFVNPIDGVAHLFGEGSINKEGERVTTRLNASAVDVDECQLSFLAATDRAVVTRWNAKTEETSVSIARAKEELSRKARVSAVAESHPNALATNTPTPRSTRLPRVVAVVLLLLALLTGLIVLYVRNDRSTATGTQRPASVETRKIHLATNTRLRKGPGVTFSGLVVLEDDTDAIVLDGSVPGWLKVQTAFGVEGWVETPKEAK